MPLLLKTVHIGSILLGRETMCTVIRGTRHEVLYELNGWFFDYFHAHQYPIRQLPPLDDWERSNEDLSYWSIAFPDVEWRVWIRSELIGFQ